MAVVALDIFEAGVFEDGIYADFTSDTVSRLDITNKIVFIKTNVTAFHPVDDMYTEVRSIRRVDESTRVMNMPVTAQGNEPAGANFTPRRAVMMGGWRIGLEHNINSTLQITGEVISDDGLAGAQVVKLDYLPSGVSMLVNYAPPSSEVIEVNTGSGVTEQDKAQIAALVWNQLNESYDTGGTFGHLVNYMHHVPKQVFCDPEAIQNGTGAQQYPFNNITDAIDMAELEGIDTIVVKSDIIIDRNVKNLKIVGVGVPEVDANNKDLRNSEFHRIKFKGTYLNPITVQESVLLNTALLNGFFENCAVAGDLTVPASASVYLKNTGSMMPDGFEPTISVGSGASVNIVEWYGKVTIANVASATSSVILNVSSGVVTIGATCTLGTILITGNCVVVDNSNGATVINQTVDPNAIKQTWQSQFNRRVHDKNNNLITLYDNDNVTPLKVFDTNADVSEITPQ